jgi:hypothetical protein
MRSHSRLQFLYIFLGSFLFFGFFYIKAQAYRDGSCGDLFLKETFGERTSSEKDLFFQRTKSGLEVHEFLVHLEKQRALVSQFQYLREVAETAGLRLWLFGGTASSFLHYVKWDLARAKGPCDEWFTLLL